MAEQKPTSDRCQRMQGIDTFPYARACGARGVWFVALKYSKTSPVTGHMVVCRDHIDDWSIHVNKVRIIRRMDSAQEQREGASAEEARLSEGEAEDLDPAVASTAAESARYKAGTVFTPARPTLPAYEYDLPPADPRPY